jgi:uncharacterized protein (TIGR03435 family)
MSTQTVVNKSTEPSAPDVTTLLNSLGQLAGALEGSVGKPVVDETALGRKYDLRLSYDSTAPEGLLEAVREIGLRVEPARRPVEFLVVTKAQ